MAYYASFKSTIYKSRSSRGGGGGRMMESLSRVFDMLQYF